MASKCMPVSVKSSKAYPKLWPILPLDFYVRPTEQVARSLLGKGLWVSQRQKGCLVQITETEAYLGAGDPASHAFRGRTPRNAPMFGKRGYTYVYFTYGMHYCLNVVAGLEGEPGAVLLRAARPLLGLRVMHQRRNKRPLHQLLAGPARLTQALGLNLSDNQVSLQEAQLHIVDFNQTLMPSHISVTPRIGISTGRESLLRYVWDASSYPLPVGE